MQSLIFFALVENTIALMKGTNLNLNFMEEFVMKEMMKMVDVVIKNETEACSIIEKFVKLIFMVMVAAFAFADIYVALKYGNIIRCLCVIIAGITIYEALSGIVAEVVMKAMVLIDLIIKPDDRPEKIKKD